MSDKPDPKDTKEKKIVGHRATVGGASAPKTPEKPDEKIRPKDGPTLH